MDIATYVKQVRRILGVSQERLADLLDCTKGNVSAWECGRHQPKLTDLQKMHDLINGQLPFPMGDPALPTQEMHPTTAAMVRLMDSLDDNGKQIIYTAAKTLADTIKSHQAPAKVAASGA